MADTSTVDFDSEFDDIVDGLLEHLRGAVPDHTIEIADTEWGCGETWEAIVYLITCAADYGNPVDSQVIALSQRLIDLASGLNLGESSQEELAEVKEALTTLKQRARVTP
ncbi:MAG: hypothetical protein LBM66_00955 [Bifidobacteriaceae bacterium]|jgi:hypothetical protein|nr:hypothetical protein [Bifidobacteriaceae bacterium]